MPCGIIGDESPGVAFGVGARVGPVEGKKNLGLSVSISI